MRGDQFLHDGAIQTESGGGLLVELREMAVSLHIGGEYRSERSMEAPPETKMQYFTVHEKQELAS